MTYAVYSNDKKRIFEATTSSRFVLSFPRQDPRAGLIVCDRIGCSIFIQGRLSLHERKRGRKRNDVANEKETSTNALHAYCRNTISLELCLT